MNPLLNQTRRLERGWEYVTFHVDENTLRTIEYLKGCDEGREQEDSMFYKKYMCTLCGYPHDEWQRVADVSIGPSPHDGHMAFTVKFAAPGKTMEALVCEGFIGSEDTACDLANSMDEEAWALIKIMLSKSTSGDASMEEGNKRESLT